MIKGVIFDLDGVLVSTDELHYQAWKRLAQELGVVGFCREDNVRQRGVSRMASLEVVLEKCDKPCTDSEKIELAERKNSYYKELLSTLDSSAVLPGAFETLKLLRDRGVGIAVGSASANTPVILEKTGLAEYIDEVSCGLDIKKSKPEPDVFLLAGAKLGLAPRECIVAEDSAAGIEAARRGGMATLAVGPNYEALGADYRARDLSGFDGWDDVLAQG